MDPRHAAFSRFLLASLGLGCVSFAGPGCGAKVVFGSEDGGGNSGGGSANGAGTSNGGSGQGGAGTGASTGQFQGGFSGTGGTSGCAMPFSVTDLGMPPEGCGGFFAQQVCYANTSCAQVAGQCALDAYECGFQSVGDAICSASETNGGCCFVVLGDCPVGRPFLVDGVARVAPLVADTSSAGWAQPVALAPAALSDAARAALIDMWQREAQAEHASIASFSRFALGLLAVGAPAALIEGAQRAAADERVHAALALGLAEAYGGPALRPGPLMITGALDDASDLAALAAASAREGCVAETVAALQIGAARDGAADPALREALDRVAADEAEHAALAWRFVQWALASGRADVREAVAAAFAEAEVHVGLGAQSEHAAEADAGELAAHGYLSVDERRRLARGALRDVVLPAAQTLLASARPEGVSLAAAI